MKIVSIDGSTSNTGVAAFNYKNGKSTTNYIKHTLFSYEKEFGKVKYTPKSKFSSKTAYKTTHTKEKKQVMESKVLYMITSITNFLDTNKPSLIIMEDTYGENDMMTLKMLSRIQGAVLLWANNHKANVIFKTPSQWRSEVGIPLVDINGVHLKRKQFKELAKSIVSQYYNLDVSDDEADAICMGLSVTGETK